MNTSSIADLCEKARAAMTAAGFVISVPQSVTQEIENRAASTPADGIKAEVKDLRSLLWSSIDNRQSRDLDQIEYVEEKPGGSIRLLVGIADVDSLVPRDSLTDGYASTNTTSVYTGVAVFPMLPDRLSTDLTSLREGVDRLAIIVEMDVTSQGTGENVQVYRAWTRNRARLSYEDIGPWLEGNATPSQKINITSELAAQLRLQQTVSIRLQSLRRENGALQLETIEPALVTDNGQIVDLKVEPKNQARDLIENFMIAANTAMAEFLKKAGTATIQRIVKTPEKWPLMMALAQHWGDSLPPVPDPKALSDFMARRKIADPKGYPELSLGILKLMGKGEYAVLLPGTEPAGHFGLAVHDYSHSTAPNRRFPDLIIQRLVKAVLRGAPSYSADQLSTICAHCMERETAARKVERLMRKIMAAYVLKDRIGESFLGVVTGTNPKGTFVRLTSPPAEGRIVQGELQLRVSDRVRVRLLSVDLDKGYIDFRCEGAAL